MRKFGAWCPARYLSRGKEVDNGPVMIFKTQAFGRLFDGAKANWVADGLPQAEE